MASSSTYSNPPCAACKFLRRKCLPACSFAPYFPPEDPIKFANVHKIFGASNVSKLLNDIPLHQREDTVNSLTYEAEARVKDPVYGCAGAISVLQKQVLRLQKELDLANADLMRYASSESPKFFPMCIMSHDDQLSGNIGQYLGKRVDYFRPNTRLKNSFSSTWSVDGISREDRGIGEDEIR